MSNLYILDAQGNPVAEPDPVAWGQWFEKAQRHVAATEIGGCEISTVFLGVNHNFSDAGPPLLWETMVFGGEFDGEMERYSTLEEAKRGHDAMVDKVTRAGLLRSEGLKLNVQNSSAR